MITDEHQFCTVACPRCGRIASYGHVPDKYFVRPLSVQCPYWHCRVDFTITPEGDAVVTER